MPVLVMSKTRLVDRVGRTYPTNRFGDVLVTDIHPGRHPKVTVRFVATGYETTVRLQCVLAGSVKDWSIPSVCGWGISFNGASRKHAREYYTWVRMIRRVKTERSYADCQIEPRWQWFVNFLTDLAEVPGYDSWINDNSWALDKDLRIPGCRLYARHTVCFVPSKENRIEGAERAWAKTRKKVMEVSTGKVYDSANEAARLVGESQTSISRHARGERQPQKWIYLDDKDE